MNLLAKEILQTINCEFVSYWKLLFYIKEMPVYVVCIPLQLSIYI